MSGERRRRSDAILTLDARGCVRGAGAGLIRMEQCAPQDVVGRHVSRLFPPEDVTAGRVERALATAATDGTHVERGWWVRPDGSRFEAEAVITATEDADGSLAGYTLALDVPQPSDPDPLTDPDLSTSPDVHSGTGPDLSVDVHPGTDLSTDVHSGTGPDLSVDVHPGTDLSTDVHSGTDAITDPDPNADSQPGTDPDSSTGVTAEPDRWSTPQPVQELPQAPVRDPGDAEHAALLPLPLRSDPSDRAALLPIALDQSGPGAPDPVAAVDRLWTVAREQAAREERQRLARELHDSVAQALYGIVLGSRTALELLDRDAAHAAEPIERIQELADSGLAEVRSLLSGLTPETPGEEGELVGALHRCLEALRVHGGDGLVAEARLGDEPATTPEAKHALYRIAQEALNNVLKHARARHVLLRLLSGPRTVTLVVSDDGVGFDSHGYFPGHLGLRSMRERAHEVGGTLKVHSRPGQGSRVRATVPALP